MPEIDRLSRNTEWIDLEFVKRERTPLEIIEKGIRHHLAGLSLSNTVVLLEELGVERSRIAIHDWVQKADLQPRDGSGPDRVAVDQKAI
jgi:putative transposase